MDAIRQRCILVVLLASTAAAPALGSTSVMCKQLGLFARVGFIQGGHYSLVDGHAIFPRVYFQRKYEQSVIT